ncbi:hypothetical protein MRX96_012384 [Rhipicephalus microplus]
MKTMMSSEDYETGKYCHATRSEVPQEMIRAEPGKAALSVRHFPSSSPDSAWRHKVDSNRLEGPKPLPSRTDAVGLLLARCSPSATQARTQFHLVHKEWRNEGFSVIGNVFFVGLHKAGSSERLQHR